MKYTYKNMFPVYILFLLIFVTYFITRMSLIKLDKKYFSNEKYNEKYNENGKIIC